MQEVLELRMPEEHAKLFLGPDDGEVIDSWVRRVDLPLGDPRLQRVAELDVAWRAQGRAFLLGWDVTRSYAPEELENLELLQLDITATFEPVGEECGTIYDQQNVCPLCGAGRRLVPPLRTDLRRVPKGKDLVQTIAGDEWILSARLAEAIGQHRITGAELRPVACSGRLPSAAPLWYQLAVTSNPVSIAPATRFGIHPFDADDPGEYRCPQGHVLGLNLLSELSVERRDWDGSDIAITREFVGVRRGLLVPRPLVLVSRKLWHVLRDEKMRGWRVERVHLV